MSVYSAYTEREYRCDRGEDTDDAAAVPDQYGEQNGERSKRLQSVVPRVVGAPR